MSKHHSFLQTAPCPPWAGFIIRFLYLIWHRYITIAVILTTLYFCIQFFKKWDASCSPRPFLAKWQLSATPTEVPLRNDGSFKFLALRTVQLLVRERKGLCWCFLLELRPLGLSKLVPSKAQDTTLPVEACKRQTSKEQEKPKDCTLRGKASTCTKRCQKTNKHCDQFFHRIENQEQTLCGAVGLEWMWPEFREHLWFRDLASC